MRNPPRVMGIVGLVSAMSQFLTHMARSKTIATIGDGVDLRAHGMDAVEQRSPIAPSGIGIGLARAMIATGPP
jgi:hypothetical protein